MITPSFNLTCLDNKKIAEGIWQFRLEKPEGFNFEAGQFVLFDAPLKDDASDIQTRAFSIASPPLEDELLFVAKIINGGRASTWIEQTLKAGDTVRTQGPFGRFLVNTDSPKDILFVCTGSGIAPFRPQVITELEKNKTRKIDLVFGTRTKEELFWQEEFNELEKKHKNFSYYAVLSKPENKWIGASGYVQDAIPSICEDLSNKQVYVCGNTSMTNEIKRLCLENWGMDEEDVHAEGYQ